MNLKLGILLFLMCCITAIKCWVELDIAGNDLSNPHPKFIEPKDKDDCDDDKGKQGGKNGVPNARSLNANKARKRRRRRHRNPKMRAAFNDVQKYAEKLKNGKASEDDCVLTSPATVTEVHQKPQLRMIDSEKIEEKEKVERTHLESTECTEIIDMEPKTSVKIETYTVPYTVTDVKYKTMTRKVVYIQRRRKIKRTMSKPILVIKRKVVKDKQTFERIIPKIIETREIINKPQVEYKIIEGPMEQVENTQPVKDADCDEAVTAPMIPSESGENNPILAAGPHPSGGEDSLPPPAQEEPMPAPMENLDSGAGYVPGLGSDPGAVSGPVPDSEEGYESYTGADPDAGSNSAVNVGYDFGHALGEGISAAFKGSKTQDQSHDDVVRPNIRSAIRAKMRSGNFEHTTTCPPGAGSGGSVQASQSLNAYGQPVLSFQDSNQMKK